MAYELHLIKGGGIPLEEWKSAVELIDGLRLTTDNAVGENPATGEEIRIPARDGDVEALIRSKGILGFGRKEAWVRFLRWSDGKAHFKATEDVMDSENPLHKRVAVLAANLNAKIIGDEGEEYDW